MKCKAPDCENDAVTFDGYCSNVCMNVAVEVAAERLASDDILTPVPDERIAEIREKNQQAHDRITEQVEAAIDGVER